MREKTKNKRENKFGGPDIISDDVLYHGKIPAHSRELESNVLGGIIMDNRLYDIISQILRAEMFYVTANQDIYRCIGEMRAKGQPVDLMTLAEELKIRNNLDSIGGAYYLAELSGAFSSQETIEYAAQKIKENWVKRDMTLMAYSISEMCYDPVVEAEDLVNKAQAGVSELANELYGHGDELIGKIFIQIAERTEKRLAEGGHMTGIPTGYTELDKLIGGWQPEFYIIAGRPSHGKTAILLDTAWKAVRDEGKTVGIFSIEMSKTELVLRLIANDAGIDMSKFKYGNLTDNDMDRMADSGKRIKKFENNLLIDDKNPLNVMEMASKARLWKAKYGLDMLAVDYLQIADGGKRGQGSHMSRNDELGYVSRGMKSISKELIIPVITGSQMSRKIEDRPVAQRRPMLADLRDSGNIEQDADAVLFIVRPEMWMGKDDPKYSEVAGLAEMYLAKHRNGPVGDFKLEFLHKYGRFEDKR